MNHLKQIIPTTEQTPADISNQIGNGQFIEKNMFLGYKGHLLYQHKIDK